MVVLRLPDSWSRWNLEMLVIEERGEPEYSEDPPSPWKKRENQQQFICLFIC